MTNLQKLQTMSADDFADYIEAVYLTGRFIEFYKNQPEVISKYNLTTVSYKEGLFESEEE